MGDRAAGEEGADGGGEEGTEEGGTSGDEEVGSLSAHFSFLGSVRSAPKLGHSAKRS